MTGFEEINFEELKEYEREWERFIVDTDQAKGNEYFWAIWLNELMSEESFNDCRALISKVKSGQVQRLTLDKEGLFLNVTLIINSKVKYLLYNLKLTDNVISRIVKYIDRVNKL